MKKSLLLSLISLIWCTSVFAQNLDVTGKITANEDGSALPGVSVSLKGTNKGTTTDQNGSYKISVPVNGVLIFSSIGYTKKEVKVAGKSVLNLALEADANNLAEVVVTSPYGSAQSKQSVTGAISTIGAKEIRNIPMANIGQMLQGFAPGVQITNQNGRPGAPAFIKIRGVGSINAGTEPLYVVDGIPVTQDAYQAINPFAIQNISILKDAASVAIFGSRGSNGVILVTTRKPKPSDGPRVELNVRYGSNEKTPDNFELMNVREKLQYELDLKFANTAVASFLTANKLAIGTVTADQLKPVWDELIAKDFNWEKELLRKAPNSTQNLSISGGTEKTSYFFGLNNYDELGITIGSKYGRRIGTVNLEFRPYKWLTVGQTANIAVRKEGLIRDRNNAQSPVRAYYTYNPYEPAKNADGSWNLTHQGFSISEAIITNPENTRTFNGLATSYLELKPINGVTLKTSGGVNYIDFSRESYTQPGSILDGYVGDPAAKGSKTDNGSTNFNYIWTNTAEYMKKIGLNNFRILGGTEFTKNNFKSYSFSSKGYPSASVSTQENGAVPLTATTAKSDWALYSLFGKANYDYANKYFVEGTVRRDGASRFGKNERYGDFYSVGAGWNLGEEGFIKGINAINTLKLRGAYGTAGNFNIGNYASLGLYRYASYGTVSTAVPSQLANPNLTWERSISSNLGFEFSMFKSRLNGVVDLYNRDTKDLLLSVPLSQTTGFSNRLENLGEMNNRGVEFELGYDIIKRSKFTYNLTVNGTKNKNKITALYNNADVPNGLTRLVVGQPIETFFMVKYAGVDPADGKAQYYNLKGEITKTYASGDAVTLKGKAPDPTHYGSITNTFTFGPVTLSAQVYLSGGNYIYNSMYQTLVSDGSNRSSLQAKDALNFWKKAGDTNVLPFPTNVTYTTDRFLQKGDFARLRNVYLGYELPKFINKLKMQDASIFVQAQNLLYLAKEYKGDPEVGFGSGEGGTNATRGGVQSLFSFPTNRSITAGINITF